MSQPAGVLPDPSDLVGWFYPDWSAIGILTPVTPSQLPYEYDVLLRHEAHMTVTLEEYHACPVEVEVLSSRQEGSRYARQSRLHRQRDQRVVQHGFVRMDLTSVAPSVAEQILAEQIPLGRILIDHQILRHVRLLQLWRVDLGPALLASFGLAWPAMTYGRTAAIILEGRTAVELLEIVAPDSSPLRP